MAPKVKQTKTKQAQQSWQQWGWPAANNSASENWKGALSAAFGKKHKRAPTKADFTYTVEEVEKSKFKATVACAEFEKNASYTGAVADSKINAEKMAAKAAVKAEFPGEKPAASQSQSGMMADMAWAMPQMMSMWGMPPTTAANTDSKSRLHQVVPIILGRPCTKDDIIFTTTAVEGSKAQYVSSLTIPGIEGGSYEGKPATGKKGAEHAVADVALETLLPLAEEKKGKPLAAPKNNMMQQFAQMMQGSYGGQSAGKAGVKTKQKKAPTAERVALKEKLKTIDNAQKAWVSGLKGNTAEELQAAFSAAGPVETVEMLSKNTACVIFGSEAAVATAIATLNDTALGKAKLKVDLWTRPGKWANKEKKGQTAE